jgi:hypothetical protein
MNFFSTFDPWKDLTACNHLKKMLNSDQHLLSVKQHLPGLNKLNPNKQTRDVLFLYF